MSGKLSHHLFFLRIRPVCVHYQTDIIDADQQSYNRRAMQKNTVLADIFKDSCHSEAIYATVPEMYGAC